MLRISYITANEVAAALGYNGLDDWGAHEKATIAADSIERFGAMLDRIKGAGFDAIDLWSAHCRWDTHAGSEYARAVPIICREKGIRLTSYAGGLMVEKPEQCETPLAFMKSLGISLWAGGIWGMEAIAAMPAINAACEKLDIRYAFENHPEKSIDELLAKIADGKYPRIGVALDIGWCGTHGIDPVEAIDRLGDKLFIVHLKDVKKAGAHETCTLGDGIVDVAAVLGKLQANQWSGDICIEHEPYNRDPMPEIMTSLKRVGEWMR